MGARGARHPPGSARVGPEPGLIHIALADDASVMTASTGFGEDRKVVIRPRGNGGPRYRRDGPGRSPGRFQGPRI